MKKIVDNVTFTLVLLFSTIPLLFTFGDMFSIINLNIPYDKLIVIMLSSIGIYFGISHFKNIKIQEDMATVKLEIIKEFEQVKDNNALNIKKFNTHSEFIEYFRNRIRTAKEVYDLSWSQTYSSYHELKDIADANYEFESTMNEVIDNLIYKEIFIFSEEARKEKCLNRLSKNKPTYSCRYYDNNSVPRIQFAIIDKEEIIWGYPDSHGDFVINNPILTLILCEYFDEVWNSATHIKDGKKIDETEIEKIKCIQNA